MRAVVLGWVPSKKKRMKTSHPEASTGESYNPQRAVTRQAPGGRQSGRWEGCRPSARRLQKAAVAVEKDEKDCSKVEGMSSG